MTKRAPHRAQPKDSGLRRQQPVRIFQDGEVVAMAVEIIWELEQEGLLTRTPEGEWVPTRRWRAAVARAALRSIRSNEDCEDPRLCYAWALLELLGDEVSPRRVADMIDALIAIEHPVLTVTTSHTT